VLAAGELAAGFRPFCCERQLSRRLEIARLKSAFATKLANEPINQDGH
jgi:hypothetical protein